MENRQEQKQGRKPLKNLTLLDRFLFDTAMSDPEISRNILSIIFSDREIPAIRFSAAEQTKEPYYDSRAVRLDVLAIDVNLLQPGDLDFGKMNDVYVIFIAPFDLFGEDKYKYTFHMTCDEVPRRLVEFLHYVEDPERYEKNIEDSRVRKLADQIDMLKSSQEVGVKYMRLWEELAEARIEGRTEGHEAGILESIENLMKRTGWPVEKVLEMLDIPEDEREKYLKLLEK